MPEIAEVYRAADYIRQHLVGRTLAVVKAQHDENVFGKVGTSAAEIEKALTGKKIVGAGQQGKYFWISMASPPHLVCHFGMAGWFHIRGIPTFYYKDTKKDKAADKEWPPKHWKFSFETKPEGEDKKVMEAAFVDFRRFSRVRLVNCAAKDIRKNSPLVENGPDPNTDKEIVTRDWLAELCHRKRAPIKAILLDQQNISGIGNWVCDETLMQSRIHPEQHAHTLSDAQITELHKQLMEVVRIAIETKSDSDKFPETWLFKHRWGKGRKAVHQMPDGAKIEFLTVAGRTSAIVPSLQKLPSPVAGEAKDKASGGAAPKKSSAKRKKDDEEEEEEQETKPAQAEDEEIKPSKTKRAKPGRKTKTEPDTSTTEQQIAREQNGTTLPGALPPTATAEDIAEEVANEATTAKASRKGRKSNPKLPPTETPQETKQLLKDSPAKRERRIQEGLSHRAKAKAPVVEESEGRRRSARIAKT